MTPSGRAEAQTPGAANERAQMAGIRNICVHKGLFPPAVAAQYPKLLDFAKVDDLARAAKDWPQLNFIIYHSAYRTGNVDQLWDDAQSTGPVDWVSDLAEIPEELRKRHGFAPFGSATGPAKQEIFGDNNARLYGTTPPQQASLAGDRGAVARAAYEAEGPCRSNQASGYIAA